MRSLHWKYQIKASLKDKPGYDAYVLANFDLKKPRKRNTLEEMKEKKKPVDHGMFDYGFIAVF